jgi:hypothetical protein
MLSFDSEVSDSSEHALLACGTYSSSSFARPSLELTTAMVLDLDCRLVPSLPALARALALPRAAASSNSPAIFLMLSRSTFCLAPGSNENFLSGSEISGDTAAFLDFFGSFSVDPLDPLGSTSFNSFFVLCAFSVVPFFPSPELFASFF